MSAIGLMTSAALVAAASSSVVLDAPGDRRAEPRSAPCGGRTRVSQHQQVRRPHVARHRRP